jgi:hypothetical protein
MSGRITTAPIRTDIATVGDYRSRGLVGDQRDRSRDDPDEKQSEDGVEPEPLARKPSLPPGPTLVDGGTAFAAAVVAGALPLKTQSPEEIQLRKGSAWAPPDSELHLTDRIA